MKAKRSRLPLDELLDELEVDELEVDELLLDELVLLLDELVLLLNELELRLPLDEVELDELDPDEVELDALELELWEEVELVEVDDPEPPIGAGEPQAITKASEQSARARIETPQRAINIRANLGRYKWRLGDVSPPCYRFRP